MPNVEDSVKIVGYCMKCKKKQNMKNKKSYKMGKKKDRDAVKGQCVVCTTNMNKILSADDKQKLGL